MIFLKARRSLESSPPDAVLDKSLSSSPTLAENMNLTSSCPLREGSIFSKLTLKLVPFICRSFNSFSSLLSKIFAFSFLNVESFEDTSFIFSNNSPFCLSKRIKSSSLLFSSSSLPLASSKNFKISSIFFPYLRFKSLIKSSRLSIRSKFAGS